MELAVVDPADPDLDDVVAIPLTEKGKQTRFVSSKSAPASESQLPFDVEVVEFFKNSTSLRPPRDNDKNLATAGIGLSYVVEQLPPNNGASAGGGVDVAAAYVQFTEKASGKDLGVYLFSQVLSEQQYVEKIVADGKTYEAALRFKRSYKPYSISLKDVKKDDYPGTTIPKNYSSDIQLDDPSRSFDDAIHIRMNEPLRYAGETFYQSGYRVDEDGTEITDLQVVTNTGWMIPYVACMLVVIGMLFHFCQVLVRFLKRLTASDNSPLASGAFAVVADAVEGPQADRSKGRGKRKEETGAAPERRTWSVPRFVTPAVIVILFVGMIAWMAQTPRPAKDGFDLRGSDACPCSRRDVSSRSIRSPATRCACFRIGSRTRTRTANPSRRFAG